MIQEDHPAKPASRKLTFMDVRDKHHFEIVPLAYQALVSPQTVYAMLLCQPVSRECAIAVLNTLSEQTGERYTLDSVDVPLELEAAVPAKKATFRSLRNKHWFDASLLAEKARMASEMVVRLILNDPVPRDYAIMILKAYNEQFGENYTLDDIDIKFTSW